MRRYTRGYIPHCDGARLTQFLTWRLADSLPAQLVRDWQSELASLPETERKREFHRRIEQHLDLGYGSQILRTPAAALAVQEAILWGDEKRYDLHGWVIMPTHVHVLLTPQEAEPLAKIVQALKGFSSKEIQKKIGGDGRLWQPDYFDRFIRDEEHFIRVLSYIEWNPVKAGLTDDPSHWPYSSANAKFART